MSSKPAIAALSVLILLQFLMLGALYTQTAPHPPTVIPLGGMAPFLSMAIAVSMGALILGPQTRAGGALSLLAALAAGVSYGPQKFADPAFVLVWPAVVTAQVAMLAIIITALLPLFAAREN